MVLETALVTLLAPVLPALMGAGQGIGQDAASAVGAEAADLARRVWDRLQGSLVERPTASAAAGDVAADPNDETARQALELQLKKLLKDDPKLRGDLAALVAEGERQGVFADRGAVVHGDVSVSGGVFVGRDARDIRRTDEARRQAETTGAIVHGDVGGAVVLGDSNVSVDRNSGLISIGRPQENSVIHAPPARYANLRVSSMGGQEHPSDQPLEPDSVVILGISIGKIDARSVVSFPVALPFVAPVEVTLKVLVASTDFVFAEHPKDLYSGANTIELPLVLPASGPARTVDGKPELLVAARTPARKGSARLRVSYYYRDAVIQSQVLSATVGGQAGRVHAETDYTASETLTDLDKIAERPRISVVTNEYAGVHTVLIRRPGAVGDPATARPASVPHSPLGSVVKELRSELVHRESTRLPRSRRDLEEDLRSLAPIGRRLYRHLFVDLKDLLPVGSGSRPILSITRPRYVRFSLPWNYVYEIAIPERKNERIPICPLVTEWDERSPLLPEPADECPRAADVDHVEGLLCPFGFWGFRQPVEAPPSVKFADASVTVPRGARIAVGETTKGLKLADLDDHIARLAKLFADRFGTDQPTRHTKVADLRKTLETDLPVVYFLCHGHKEPGKPDTWLGLGDREFFTSDDFVDWVSAGRARERIIWDKIRPLVVINACHSVDISPETLVGYVDAFSAGANAKGVIGTEVRVPVPLAMAWAETFFESLVEDGTDALTALARARWRFLAEGSLFGLVYTPYCWGHLQLTADLAA